MIYPWNNEIKNPVDETLIYPRYDGLSLVNIPNTVLNFHGITGPNPPLAKNIQDKIPKKKKTILFLVDGLGFLQWEHYSKENSLLKMISDQYDVFPLTSVFPSTTPAAITAVNSGLIPAAHGLPEWFVYLKEIDKVIESLPFMPAGSLIPDILYKEGVDPHVLLNETTIYESLNTKNIKSYSFIESAISNSAYNTVALSGSEIVSFSNELDLLQKLIHHLENEPNESYFYVYWGELDSLCHKTGPYSDSYKKALNKFTDLFLQIIMEKKETFKDSIFLFTADHGQIDINAKDAVLLNEIPGFMENLAVGKNGKTIVPWGNCRDVFLQVKDEKLKKTETFLKEKLSDKAHIIRTSELIKVGLFGLKTPSPRFMDRIGNLMIIPKGENTVWYSMDDTMIKRFYTFKGHHGGLTPEEMLIPFGIFNPGSR